MIIRMHSTHPVRNNFIQFGGFKLLKIASANSVNIKQLNSELSNEFDGLSNHYRTVPSQNNGARYKSKLLFNH
ncbi:hypothetical protein [Alteribacillus sp. YIM 98480]|uniref:hypothetical protein n=1 Tax=Alteribacillus sp. YIM 98480 TaxID=2606599 RepID=UPI0018EEF105|nr:hypothetical protein [Alteribacillus sp. YIM 98480]